MELSEKDAAWIIIRLWWFTAENFAFNPVILDDDSEALADFCGYDGDPKKLMDALTDSGFLETSGYVHKWLVHQPLAEKILEDRKRRDPEKSEVEPPHKDTGNFPEKNTIYPDLNTNFPELSPEKDGKLPLKETQKETQNFRRKHRTSEVVEDKSDSHTPVYRQILSDWNHLAKEFPSIPALTGLSDSRREHIRARCKETGWDWSAIVAGIRASPWLRGEVLGRDKTPFSLSFEYVFIRKDRWREIIENKYNDKSKRDPGSTVDHGDPTDTDYQRKLREKERAKHSKIPT
jgi:hypothetical protein